MKFNKNPFAILIYQIILLTQRVSSISFAANSVNGIISNHSLSSIPENDGLNYVVLLNSTQDYVYDYSTGSITYNGGGPRGSMLLSVADEGTPFLQFIPAISLDDFQVNGTTGALYVNGSSNGFYACKNVDDPSNFSASNYVILFYGTSSAASSCVAIEITTNVAADGDTIFPTAFVMSSNFSAAPDSGSNSSTGTSSTSLGSTTKSSSGSLSKGGSFIAILGISAALHSLIVL